MNLQQFLFFIGLTFSIFVLEAQSGHAFELSILDETHNDYIYGGDVTADSAIIVGGYTSFSPSKDKSFLAKVDIHGNVIWRKYYAAGTDHSRFYNVRKLEDGNLLGVGRAGNNYDALIFKFDQAGNEIFLINLKVAMENS